MSSNRNSESSKKENKDKATQDSDSNKPSEQKDPEDFTVDDFQKQIEERPAREKFEEVTEKIPDGPMGKVGGGDLLGAAGYVAVESTKPVWQFIPGIRQPGYQVTAHGTKKIEQEVERHVLTVNAISKNIGQFAAQYVASPSNIDFVRSEVKLVDTEELTQRGTYSTYQMTVDVITEGAKGKGGNNSN